MAYLLRAQKSDLISLAKDLGVPVSTDQTKVEIKNLIAACDDYDEDCAKAMLEAIREEREAEKREAAAEREAEKREAEREAEAAERDAIRRFELERLRLANSAVGRESTPQPLEHSVRRSPTDMKRLLPKFNIEETDISLFLAMFELQAQNVEIDENEWAAQLLALLPIEIGQLVLRESVEDARNYRHVKSILLERFKMSPEIFRQKFAQHTRKPGSRWKDFSFELREYLDGWIDGLRLSTFEDIKNLMIADQIKRRVGVEVREHFVDRWESLVNPAELCDALDKYESVRQSKPARSGALKRDFPARKMNEPGQKSEGSKEGEKNGERHQATLPRTEDRDFERRKPLRCYECQSESHLRNRCPFIKKREPEILNNVVVGGEPDKWLEPYLSVAKVNGVEMPILRDTGATFDVVARRYVPQENFTGEVVFLQQPLDVRPKCLPVAKVVLEGIFDKKLTTKAAVMEDRLDQQRYILGNRSYQLIKNCTNEKPERSDAVSGSQEKTEPLTGPTVNTIGATPRVIFETEGAVRNEPVQIPEASASPAKRDNAKVSDCLPPEKRVEGERFVPPWRREIGGKGRDGFSPVKIKADSRVRNRDSNPEKNRHVRVGSETQKILHLVTQDIAISADNQIRVRRYRMSPRLKELIREEIEKGVELREIDPGEEDYSSPLKSEESLNKTPKGCVDCRFRNEGTRTEV